MSKMDQMTIFNVLLLAVKNVLNEPQRTIYVHLHIVYVLFCLIFFFSLLIFVLAVLGLCNGVRFLCVSKSRYRSIEVRTNCQNRNGAEI